MKYQSKLLSLSLFYFILLTKVYPQSKWDIHRTNLLPIINQEKKNQQIKNTDQQSENIRTKKEKLEFYDKEVKRFRKEKKWSQALIVLKLKLAIETELPGDHYEEIVRSLRLIAEMQQELEQWTEADITLTKIVSMERNRFGKDNWRVVNSEWDLKTNEIHKKFTAKEKEILAWLHSAKIKKTQFFQNKDYNQAVNYAEQIWKQTKALYGENNPLYLQSLHDLANCCLRANQREKSLTLLLQAKALASKILGENHPESVAILNLLGLCYSILGQNEKALPIFVKSMELNKQMAGENQLGFIYSVNNLASCYLLLKQNEKALPLFVQAKNISLQCFGETSLLYVNSLDNLADCYSRLGKHEMAVSCLQQAKELIRKRVGENHLDYLNQLNNLALVYTRLQEYEQALPLYLQAKELQIKLCGEKHPDYIQSIITLAHCYFKAHQSKKALPLFEQAKNLQFQMVGEKDPEYLVTLQFLALCYSDLGYTDKAMTLLLHTKELTRELFGEDHLNYAQCLTSLAHGYSDLGQYDKALLSYQQASRIRLKLQGENHPDYARSLNNLAYCYQQNGRNEKALPLFVKVRELQYKNRGEKHSSYALSLNNLASCYSDLGQYEKALPLYLQSNDLQRNLSGEKHLGYAVSLNNLASCYAKLNRNDTALPLFIQAQMIFRSLRGENHSDYTRSINNLAECYTKLNDYKKALPLFEQARETVRKIKGENSSDYALSLNNLASCYSKFGQNEKALPLFLQSMELTSKLSVGNRSDYASSLYNLASCYSKLDQKNKALKLYHQAVSIMQMELNNTAVVLSEQEQISYQQTVLFYLDNYFDTAIQVNANPVEIYEVVLNVKGSIMARQRALRWQRNLLAQTDPQIRALITQLKQLSSQISFISRRGTIPGSENRKQSEEMKEYIAQLSQQRENLESQLAQKLPDWQKWHQPITFETIQRFLPKHSALLDFSVIFSQSKDSYIIGFYIPKNGSVQMKMLGKTDDLVTAISSWRNTIQHRYEPIEFTNDPAIILRERLLVPWLKEWSNFETLFISTDGVLGNIVFTALPGKNSKKFLIEEKTVALLPVVKLLPEFYSNRTRQHKENQSKLMLYGGIEYGEIKKGKSKPGPLTNSPVQGSVELREIAWPKLPATKIEIESIAALFDETHPNQLKTVRSGKEANKANFVNDLLQSEIAHIATHGFFELMANGNTSPRQLNPTNQSEFMVNQANINRLVHPGVQSGLVLAGANQPTDQEDGIITALEIAELDLSYINLAVLSACETGLGKEVTREGTIGLLRAFQIAGCKNVIASSWEIGDRSTAAIMKLFYWNHWQKKQSPLEALRQAQLGVMDHQDLIDKLGRGIALKNIKIDSDGKKISKKNPKSLRATVGQWASFSIAGIDP